MLLFDTSDFIKGAWGDNVNLHARCVGGPFFAALAALTFKGLTQMPYIKNACLKANLTCPTVHVDGGVCSFITKKDIAKLGNPAARDEVGMAEMIMTGARGLLE